MRRRIIAFCCCWFVIATQSAFAQQFTLSLTVNGRDLVGNPVAWSDQRVFLMARDGHLWDFAPDEAERFSKTSDRFQPLTHGEMRGALMKEMGRGFEVSGAGQYVVVHPAGQRDEWAPRFDELYRSFIRYFSVRGIDVQRAQFPLIAVVFPTQADFYRYAQQSGDRIAGNVLGYYSTESNRILLYDVTADQPDSVDWSENAATIIHEAAHQAAFNTGVHSRFAPPPRWLAEGLGTMFEAHGVWNSRMYASLSDRINVGRLEAFRRYAQKRKKGSLIDFVSSDRPFQVDADAAYAEAWALTIYLVENEPRKYQQYLQRTAARSAFVKLTTPERLQEFIDVFGSDVAMLETRMLRYVSTLK